jgi:hypothetical protein
MRPVPAQLRFELFPSGASWSTTREHKQEVAQFIYLLLNNERIRHVIGPQRRRLLQKPGAFAGAESGGSIAVTMRSYHQDPRRTRLPDGFSVSLDCPSDWGDDEIATCKGVAEQLGAVGIDVTVNFLSTDELSAKLYKHRQSDFFLDGEHMDPDSERVLPEWFSQNYGNVTGYANPRGDELIENIKTEMVTYARDAYRRGL